MTSQATLSIFRHPDLVRRIARVSRGFRRPLLGLALVVTCSAVLPLVQPFLFGRIVDAVVSGAPYSSVVTLVVLVLLVGLGGVGFNLIAGRLAASVGYRIISDLQRSLFEHLLRMPVGFFTTVQPGAIVSRLTNDVYATEPLFTQVGVAAFSHIVTFLVAVCALFSVDARLPLVALLVPLAVLPIRRAEARINQTLADSFTHNAVLSVRVESVLNRDSILIARQCGQTESELHRFSEASERVREVSVRLSAWRSAIAAIYGALFNVMVALALGVGVYLVSQDRLSLGSLVLTLFYVKLVETPVTGLIGLRYPALRAAAAFLRVFDVLDSPLRPLPARQRAESDSAARRASVALRFEGLTFAYPPIAKVSIKGLSNVRSAISIASFPLTGLVPDSREEVDEAGKPVLLGIDFSIDRGEMVAVVGHSGVGKSTIAMLAAGLILPDEGRVLIEGTSTSAFSEANLAERVAMITQDTHVLHDTIRENLRYARPDADDESILEACRSARLDRLIDALPGGLDTVVGERGHRLSGGERQRLGIARALLKDAVLVVLDEPTSQLDSETEVELRASFAQVFADRAVLVIAHRLSTIVDADRILVLDGGRIAESGPHDELMARPDGKYRRLYGAQLTGHVAPVRNGT